MEAVRVDPPPRRQRRCKRARGGVAGSVVLGCGAFHTLVAVPGGVLTRHTDRGAGGFAGATVLAHHPPPVAPSAPRIGTEVEARQASRLSAGQGRRGGSSSSNSGGGGGAAIGKASSRGTSGMGTSGMDERRRPTVGAPPTAIRQRGPADAGAAWMVGGRQ